jgi:DMSO/TMAO reductase YedYZ molybdopterin-dependent catalytic subunit
MTKSRFRPDTVLNPALLDEHRGTLRQIERRFLFRGSLSLGALALLGGCKLSDDAAVQSVLRAISSFNDGVQALLFDPNKLAPTYREADVVKPPRFNAYYEVEKIRPVDGATWKLELAGRISDKKPWTAPDLAALPQREEIIRHICVEGWDYIGQWSGVSLRTFLERVGADLSARYVAFRCADDYWGSIDMPTALHAQTLLATHYAHEPLADPFGFPLRLRTATKLGFKNPKWITAIEVTNTYPGGYWENQGFNWFSGL